MESEYLVGLLAMVLEASGWFCLATVKLAPAPRWATVGKAALLLVMMALGVVVLFAAALQTASALTGGMTLSLLVILVDTPDALPDYSTTDPSVLREM